MSIQDLRHYGLFSRKRVFHPWWLMKRVLFALSAMLFLCPVILRTGGASGSRLPEFTFTGTYALIDDGDGNWRIRFLTSGTLIFTKRNITVDAFGVGGGGSGGRGGATNYGSGGGGGYTSMLSGLVLSSGIPYSVVIGAGGTTPAIGSSGNLGGTTSLMHDDVVLTQAFGGHGGIYNGTVTYPFSAGGSGGSRASYGVNGGSDGSTPVSGGIGQGTTTREFGEPDGDLYAAGGGGAVYNTGRLFGGEVGGGDGGSITPAYAPTGGLDNTGSGGGGGASGQGGITAGGSGLFALRNHRAAA